MSPYFFLFHQRQKLPQFKYKIKKKILVFKRMKNRQKSQWHTPRMLLYFSSHTSKKKKGPLLSRE